MSNDTRLVQGRLGYVRFTLKTSAGVDSGSAFYIPVYDWNIQSRRMRVTGDPVGNSFSTNYAEGMSTSRFVARVMVRKSSTEAMTAKFLGRFIDRTVTGGIDDTLGFKIEAHDGAALHTLDNAKPESFTISIMKGSPIGLSVVMVAPTAPVRSAGRLTDGSTIAQTYGKSVDDKPVLMFNAATFFRATAVSGLAASVDEVTELYNCEITYSNNHIVDAPLDGTLNASSFDAGFMRCGATFTIRAFGGGGGDVAPFNSGDGDLPTALRVKLALASSDVCILDLSLLVPDTDRDAAANIGASYRTWQCLVLGVGGASPVKPLQITAPAG